MDQVSPALRQKDPEALHAWVHEHYRDIFRFLRHLTRHTEAAEDLTQQTFLHAVDAISKFEGRSAMRTWLHSIAFREYVGWRKRQRWLAPLEALGGTKDRRIDGIDSGEALLDALYKLQAPIRESFLMHEVQQLSLEEIAAIFDCPEGTVKWRLHEARTQLRRLLQNTFPEVSYGSR